MIQSETVQPEIYWCRKCEAETLTANPTCPKCGRKMQTQSTVKGLGKLLIGCGVIITLGSGLGVVVSILVLFFAKLKEHEIIMAFLGLAMCGAATLAGIAAIFGGFRQSKTGRTSKLLMWIYLGLVFFIIIFGGLFSILKG